MFQKFIGEKMLRYVSVRDCIRFQEHLLQQGVKPASVNEFIAKLHTAFEAATKWGYLSDNPLKKVQRLKVQKTPPAFMTGAQVQLVLEALPEFWRRVFLFAVLTGCRPSELVNLRWEDIDFLKRCMQIGSRFFDTKTRKVRVIPMHEALFNMLQEMKDQAKSVYVFSKTNGQPYTPVHLSGVFKHTVRKLGLPEELHLHSTRHTFASLLVQNGVPIYSVSKLLGHSSVLMTQRYSNLQPEQLSKEVQQLKILP
jgi:integrase